MARRKSNWGRSSSYGLPRDWKKKLLGVVAVLVLGYFGLLSSGGPNEFSGVVTHVADGDTLTVQTGQEGKFEERKIRIYGIDAPETGQSYGTQSKVWLTSRIMGRPVTIREKNRDNYGRIVGEVYSGEENIGLNSIRSGMAWYYESYAKKEENLRTAQEEARSERKGLWADRNPLAPWLYRKEKR